MNAVSRFDTNRQKRFFALPKSVRWVLYALGGFVAIALIFQFFLRYQYLENGGVLWRVDRLTQQMCQVSIGTARCAAVVPSTSVTSSLSTSTSTSTSTSLSAKPQPKVKPH